MLSLVPLMILPFAVYNFLLLGTIGMPSSDVLQDTVISLKMMSGAIWTMSFGDLLIAGSLVILFVEILKSTRRAVLSVADQFFSMLLFAAFLAEFLLVPDAATEVYFVLTMIAFVDAVAGFSISIHSANRDVSIGL